MEEVPATESEAIIIDSAATTEHATPECIQEIAKEVNQELPSSTDTNNGDDGECSHQNNAVVTEATDSENSQDGSQQQEKAVDDDNPLDMQRNQQPVEQGGNLESEHEEDNRVDSTVETTQVDQVQVHLEASGEETKQGDQGEVNEQEAIVENKHEENETGSSDGPEAQEPAAVIQAEEEVVESTTTTTETLNCSEQSEPIQTEETVPQEVLGDTSNGIETTAEQITEASTDNEQTKDESVVEEVTNELEKVIDAYDEKTETLENGIQIRESTPPTETHFDTPHAELITDSPSEVIANEERLIDDDNKQVDEIEVAPVRVVAQSRPAAAQRLGASSPQLATNSHAEPKASGSAAKSPGKTSQDNEFLRKPEWLRRPLVRKGSVGRFIGRMRTTMQSKRFHPDRLPVVPPPQPEPPKRPPRRKTLANIDVTREIESATKQEQNLVEATPKSAPVVADFESKSATLRSTTSDRKRKNSVGRFIGRVLSTKYLNATEGTAAAEEAPLLNQENQPTTPQPSTPAPSEKSKKGPVMAVNDVGIFIRRILRPKMPGAEESKEKPLPQRPPPPSSRHQTPTPNEADRKDDNSFIKSGRVRFECQVFNL